MSDHVRQDDFLWQHWRDQWDFTPGLTYLMHGAKGSPPRRVLAAWREWVGRLEANPMEFATRTADELMLAARSRLAGFVGCKVDDLVFMINTTMGIHAVAASLPLAPGDEVVLSNHDYGIVRRTWTRACEAAGAKLVIARLPWPMRSAEDVINGYLSAVTPRTKLLMCSHVTSPTAAILPVKELTRRAREMGLLVCIDGAHGPAMLPLNIAELDCDFYAASCHKWLCAPAGTGFLYVHPRVQSMIRPLVVSFGSSWRDVWWCGTRDFTPFLTIPAAIDFVESVGLDKIRARTHALARYARTRIGELIGLEPLMPDSPDWYGSMISLPLPPGDSKAMHHALWEKYKIEVSLGPWEDKNLLRLSPYIYNLSTDIDRLVDALKELGLG